MESDLQPHRDLTPAACRSIVQALGKAESSFRSWGVRIPPQAALRQAKRWLSELGTRDTLLDLNAADLKKTSEAVALAVDLYHISTTLGNDPHPLVGAELGQTVRGAPPSNGSVQDFIAQFWIGTLLAQSGLKPRIEAFDRMDETRPDFLAEWGTMDFVVEVKCPKSRESAKRAVSTAANQLRGKPQPAVIAVDATYAFGIDPTFISREGNDRVRDQFRAAHTALHNALVKHVEGYRRSDKFSRVAVLFSFVRFWSWHIESSAERDAGIILISTAFPTACHGLVSRHADGFQRSLPKGIQQLTGNPPQLKWT
ncbi:hypothetical protein [Longimicrobium sp.]|uniref:hypothetical protein n=1 Tax=Longimicrobium sp. TaxID=2029185 RepID=UPI003B3AF71A